MPWTEGVPNSRRSMTTSSSERIRCTRISPSAILDDRLEGKDLEWALEHLKSCDVCRDRIEEFREIVIRVERLPIAPIAPAIVRDAYTWAIPEGQRTDSEASLATVETIAPEPARVEPARIELPQWEVPLEEEPPPPVSSRSVMAEEKPPVLPHAPPLFPIEDSHVHAVDFDSRRPAPAPDTDEKERPAETPVAVDEQHEARVATMTRVAVGLGAAACVLLAGLLYVDGSALNPFRSRPASSHSPAATVKSSTGATTRPSVRPSPSVAASVSASPAPTASAATIATLGDGVAGAQVFRIRLGTADPHFTRLVFDMNAQGLPTMTITQPDASHLVLTFKDTTGAGVATGGIRTARVAGLEPAAQQGNDLVFTVDLARPVQVKAFTLTGPPRLVLDLY